VPAPATCHGRPPVPAPAIRAYLARGQARVPARSGGRRPVSETGWATTAARHHHLPGQRLAWTLGLLPRGRRSLSEEGEAVGRVELELGPRRDAAARHPRSCTARRRPPAPRPRPRAGTRSVAPCVCVRLPVSLHACVDRIGRALRACGCVHRIGIRPSSSRCSPLFLFKKARYGCGAGVAGMQARVEYFLARQLISIGFGDIPHPCPRADSRTHILAHRVYCPRACGYFIPVAIFNRRSFKDQEM
jgi:hypothetical protein